MGLLSNSESKEISRLLSRILPPYLKGVLIVTEADEPKGASLVTEMNPEQIKELLSLVLSTIDDEERREIIKVK